MCISEFEHRILKNALTNSNKNIGYDIAYHEIEQQYNQFKKEYQELLQKQARNVNEIQNILSYFNITIALYHFLYTRVIDASFNKKMQVWPNKDKDSLLAILYLLRLMFHDIITLRNLTNVGFDAQFHSISRNLVEKIKIICLSLSDEEFFDVYTGIDKISDSELYNRFTKPKKLDNRIKHIAFQNEEKGSILVARNDIRFCKFLNEEALESRVKLSHSFVHTNNFRQLAHYFNENGKYNLSLKHNSPLEGSNAYRYMCEFVFLSFSYIDTMLSNSMANLKTYDFEKLYTGIYDQYIKDYYR